MRIRSTKPEFWRSERVTRVSWDARLVLKGLESYVDDNGVGRDDLALIVGDLFQRDLVREPSRTLARVSEAISDLADAGLLWRYVAEDTELLYLSFWEQIQRVDKPQPGRFPRPDGTMNYKDSSIRESVANVRDSSRALAPGTGEQRNRGTEEQAAAAALPEPHHARDGDELPPPPDGPEITQSQMLLDAGLPPWMEEDFLQALKDKGANSTTAMVIALYRKGQLRARIQEWEIERDRDAKVPKTLTTNITKTKRGADGAPVTELCGHDFEVGRCPTCRAEEAAAS